MSVKSAKAFLEKMKGDKELRAKMEENGQFISDDRFFQLAEELGFDFTQEDWDDIPKRPRVEAGDFLLPIIGVVILLLLRLLIYIYW